MYQMIKYSIGFLLFATIFLSPGCSLSNSGSSQPVLKTNIMPKVGVQLWSVKEDLKADFEGTLKQLANMGFQGVEFAGEFAHYKNNPSALKVYLDSIGLLTSGAHIQFEQLNEENFDATVKFYKALGCNVLIVPWDERAFDDNRIKDTIMDLTTYSKKLADYNMLIGYHKHDREFQAFKQTTYWDYLAMNTPDNVVLQQDVGWTTFAGKDPVEYVKRYPGRTLTTHYKSMLPKNTAHKLPIIGKDVTDWVALLIANRDVGGTQWIIIEQEEYPMGLTPLEAVAESMKGLTRYITQLELESG